MNLWQRLNARKTIVNTFKKANLYLGDEQRYIFPKVRNISTNEITFTLPTGLDPSIIKKNFFVFQQVYGKHIEIKGDVKTFTLVLSKMPKDFPYNFDSFKLQEYKLPIVAGINKSGETFIYDMVKFPHLLIAGETGSGKSTQLRSVLTTLIKTLSPKQLELYLCDLKRSEFHIFRNIPHVKGPFISVNDISPQLHRLRLEMQKRGDLLDLHEVSHIDELPFKIPYLILCIDEVALLKKEKEIMEIVEEISSIGRALGVFLILSMQRPDSEVMDGKLKVNLTVRMGFKTADRINSRIIGTPGSEKIKESGIFIFKHPKFDDFEEIRAPYLTLDKAKKLLNVNKQNKNVKSDVVELNESEESIFEVLDE